MLVNTPPSQHRISDYKVSSPPPPRVARGHPAGFLKSPAFDRFNATPLHGLLLMEKTLHQQMTEIYWATCWRFGGMLSHAPCPVHPPLSNPMFNVGLLPGWSQNWKFNSASRFPNHAGPTAPMFQYSIRGERGASSYCRTRSFRCTGLSFCDAKFSPSTVKIISSVSAAHGFMLRGHHAYGMCHKSFVHLSARFLVTSAAPCRGLVSPRST